MQALIDELPGEQIFWLRFTKAMNHTLGTNLTHRQWREEVNKWGILEYEEVLYSFGFI